MARFSVVVPAYNAEETLAQTLDAVLAQDFGDWECVIVDDGSVDGTRALAESYMLRDGRFRIISQPNQGSAGAYNTGVGGSTGDYIVLCSADDILLAQHLRSMSEFIADNPGYDIYSTNGYYWKPGSLREIVYGAGEMADSLTLVQLVRNCFYSVGAAYIRPLFDQLGGYRLDVFGEDYDFWLRALAAGATHRYLPMPLSLHRVSATQKSANHERAYRSDMRLLSDLKTSAKLPADVVAAIDSEMALKEQLTGELGNPLAKGAMRRAAARAAGSLVGPNRVRRLIRRLRTHGKHEA